MEAAWCHRAVANQRLRLWRLRLELLI